MKINFTKKQFKALMDLVYLGEWMANSTEIGSGVNKEYKEIAQYIYSLSKDFGYDDTVEYETKYKEYFPTKEYEEEMEPYIEEYDVETFWNEISIRLARRDVQKMKNMFISHDDYIKKLFEVEDQYEKEFEKHGLARLVINTNK